MEDEPADQKKSKHVSVIVIRETKATRILWVNCESINGGRKNLNTFKNYLPKHGNQNVYEFN